MNAYRYNLAQDRIVQLNAEADIAKATIVRLALRVTAQDVILQAQLTELRQLRTVNAELELERSLLLGRAARTERLIDALLPPAPKHCRICGRAERDWMRGSCYA